MNAFYHFIEEVFRHHDGDAGKVVAEPAVVEHLSFADYDYIVCLDGAFLGVYSIMSFSAKTYGEEDAVHALGNAEDWKFFKVVEYQQVVVDGGPVVNLHG